MTLVVPAAGHLPDQAALFSPAPVASICVQLVVNCRVLCCQMISKADLSCKIKYYFDKNIYGPEDQSFLLWKVSLYVKTSL